VNQQKIAIFGLRRALRIDRKPNLLFHRIVNLDWPSDDPYDCGHLSRRPMPNQWTELDPI
jgi:hypothetical protein